jgi:putative aminopeptidase FrvX
MINKTYADFSWEQAASFLAVDSPSCFTAKASAWVKNAFEELGYSPVVTNKGGVIVDLGGEDVNDGLLLSAHGDTLGAMVAEVKGNGRLKVQNLGGMRPENSEGENVVRRRRQAVFAGVATKRYFHSS